MYSFYGRCKKQVPLQNQISIWDNCGTTLEDIEKQMLAYTAKMGAEVLPLPSLF